MWTRIFILACIFNLSSSLGNMEWEGGDQFSVTKADLDFLYDDTKFVPENVMATKMAIYQDMVIILTPRFREGVLSSLYAYNTSFGLPDPVFAPFPNLAENDEKNYYAIQNAVDFYLDDKDMLWVLDSGVVETLESPKTVCKPKIVCISMRENNVTARYIITNFVTSKSRLDNIVVEYDQNGDPFVFISDSGANSLLICDITNLTGSKAIIPSYTKHSKDEEKLNLMLLKPSNSQPKLLISYMSSTAIFSFDSIITLMNKPTETSMTMVAKKVKKMAFLGTDKENIYFNYPDERDVYRWSTNETNDQHLKPIYTSRKGLLPMSVCVKDGSVKLMEVAYDDFMECKCRRVVAVHRVREIARV